MNDRTFVQHFLLVVATAVAFWFLWLYGVPQLVYDKDLSHVTTAIAATFVGMTAYIGWLAWRLNEFTVTEVFHELEFAWFIEDRLLRIGLLGTVIGLSLQAAEMANGLQGLLPLSTALYTTATGIAASLVLAVMTYNVKAGIDKYIV